MPLTFDPIFAYDPNNPNTIAKDAAITIFDPADSSKAPIAITDPTGSPLPNPITVDSFGMGPAFQHPTLERVGWTGAGFTNYLTSYEGMKKAATDAKIAAQAAAATAGAEAAAVATAAIGTATGAATEAATSANAAATAAANAAALVGAPADAAIAAAVKGTGATKAALSDTYVPKWGANTAYLAGTQVLAPTGEIVSAKVDFTSGASFVAGNWNFPVSGGGSGLTAQNVSGVLTLPVISGYTYELTATANATVALTGLPGAQVAVVLATGGFTVTIAGNALTNGTYVAHKQTAGWVLFPVGTARTDITPPTAGTLGISVTETTANLTVTGAMDDVALHADPYRFSKDGGTTWTAWQAPTTYAFTGLTAGTSYPFRHEVRDAALNQKAGTTVTTSTTAAANYSDVFTDNFTGVADGTALAGRTTATGAIVYTATSTAKVTGERVYKNVHGESALFIAPYAATKRVRFTGAYEVGRGQTGSDGRIRIGITTVDTQNNSIAFYVTYAAGTATISFNEIAAGTWTASIPTATGHPATGTFEFTFNPAGKSGALKLNGVEVATFTGDTAINPYGFTGGVENNFAALDTLKGEVSST